MTVCIVDLRAKYSMVGRIADGSFGLVYQMKSKVTQGLVAAKRLRHRKPEDVYFSRKEVHILSKISGGLELSHLLTILRALHRVSSSPSI